MSGEDGYRFTCALGVLNFWMPLTLDGKCFGFAILQSAKRAQARRPGLLVCGARQFDRAAKLLQLLVLDAIRTESAPHPSPDSGPAAAPCDGLVKQLLDRIHRDWSRPLCLKTLAGEFHRNAAYLSSLFTRTTGQPFKIYLTNLRLARACDLLIDPALSIGEVAYRSGFNDLRQFRRVFLRRYGESPRAARSSSR